LAKQGIWQNFPEQGKQNSKVQLLRTAISKQTNFPEKGK
jgi:hypothetical protein